MKENISARIEINLLRESKKVADKRDVSFSRFVEIALIHELNRNGYDNGLLSELNDIKDYIEKKIGDLSVISDDDLDLTVKDINYYVERLVAIHNKYGKVDVKAVEESAKKSGVTFEEMIQLLKKYGDFNYV